MFSDGTQIDRTNVREFFERIRWGAAEICPHCGKWQAATILSSLAVREGLYRCRVCRRQFTVTVGTILDRTHLHLYDWLCTICYFKDARPSTLTKDLRVSYKTASFMLHLVEPCPPHKNLIRAPKLYGSMPPAPFVRCCLDVVGCVSNSYVRPDRWFRLGRRNDFSVPASAIFVSSRRRESVSAQTTRHVHGAKTKAPTGDRFGSFHSAQLTRFFDWRSALTVVKPDTLIRWHRKGFRLFWKWKSRPSGRPRIPVDLRNLIGEMAMNNPTWGEERITNELLLKLGIQISPRTVRRYMPPQRQGRKAPAQRWMTFVRNQANAFIAADFFVVATATFRLMYVLVIMEIGTRRILHFNVTQHPTAEWTLQQFRECVAGDEGYRFVIHDRDSIYSRNLDSSLRTLRLRVLKTPYRSPQAKAYAS